MWFTPTSVRSAISRRLTPERKLWVSKLRHGELDWQRSLRSATSREQSVTAGYDAREAQRLSLAEVRRVLANSGVDFVELPGLSEFGPTLIVNAKDTRSTVSSLMRRLRMRQARNVPVQDERESEGSWTIRMHNARGSVVGRRAARKRPESVTAITCLRHCIAPNGRELSTPSESVTVEFWEELGPDVQRADGDVHLTGTLRRQQTEHNLVVDYIEPTIWHHSLGNDCQLSLPAPHLRVLHEPVDIVYTWVDGSDPAWRARMRSTRDDLDLRTTEPSSTADSRFTSRDELKYSLRSLEYYASWARRIFIVTDQQVPGWLDTDHPKITMVDHRDIFSDLDALPVFNSHAIESQLHHISGLADRYLYLNDDCFFLKPTDPELFFTANGLAKHFPSVVPIDLSGWSPRDLPIISAAKQGRDHVLEKYGRTVTHRFKHTPHAQLRLVLETMESEEPEMFAKVAASPFRSPEDVSIPSSLHHFDAFERGRSVEGRIGYQFIDLSRNDLDLQLSRVARRTDLDVFCLNETALAEESMKTVNATVARFFNERFPVPSSFEL